MQHNSFCDYCGKPIYIKPNRLKTQKNKACCMEHSKILRSVYFKGENNHQFGKKGKLNSSYNNKNEKIKNNYKFIRDYEHPFNVKGWVREHRIIAEKFLLNDDNSIIINGKKYLKPELEVHHKDENKLNNLPENLIILTKAEHQKIHCDKNKNKIKRDIMGRFLKR